MRRVKSLETEAKQNLSICCQSIMDREVVEKYIAELEAEILRLDEIIKAYAIKVAKDANKG